MSRRQGGRIAVYIVTTPAGFAPQRAWHYPESFTDAALHARNLLAGEAKQFARVFNDRALLQKQRGAWEGKWAIVANYLRPDRNVRRCAGTGGDA